jgi:hypothetical protein
MMTHRHSRCQQNPVNAVLEFASMAKDTRLTFRVDSELKEKLETVAKKESRSVAQICEAFLRDGLKAYAKGGANYLSRLLSSDLES